MSTPNVEFVKPEVTAMLPKWQRIRDCIDGEQAVKDHDRDLLEGVDEPTRYLPKPNADDEREANQTRYSQYIDRAVFYNVTARTHRALVGQAFQTEPVIELPSLLEPLLTDVDGAGVGLASQAKKTLGNVLDYGRSGLLTDYPAVPEGESVTKAAVDAGDVRPTITRYDPWAIINWRTKVVGAKRVLSLVVLAESHSVEQDNFEDEVVEQWRALYLDAEGNYHVDIYRKQSEGGKTVVGIAESYAPKDARGKLLREIPFQFVGAENNDVEMDSPPMLDLADLNLAHYRNSADYEESSFICGQPTPVITGLTQVWKDTNFNDGIRFGSRAGIALPARSDAKLLQAEPNGMPFEAMQAKERQMVALGAKLVEQRAVQRTAAEAKQEYATELSTVDQCAKNVKEAYERCLAWAGQFAGTDEASSVGITSGFDVNTMTPEELTAIMATWQGKAITTTEMRAKLRSGGVATLDDEAYKEEIASTPDYGGGSFDPDDEDETTPPTETPDAPTE